MYGIRKFHKNESGQTALETAIILIAFVVVASVFAFTILSAGSASTTRGEQAIYSGLEGVQSSLQTVGTVLAESADGNSVSDVRFTVQLAAGGGPINLNDLLVSYRDSAVVENLAAGDLTFEVLGTEAGEADLLEDGERVEVTVTVPAAALAANQNFTLEIKPPTGAVLQINKTTPAALSDVMELR